MNTNPNTKNRKAKAASILTSALIFSGTLAFAPQTALADTGGGSGGGCTKGYCTLTAPFYWRYTATGGGKTAWQKFAGMSGSDVGYSGNSYTRVIQKISDGSVVSLGMSQAKLLETCKTSKIIWWVSATQPAVAGRKQHAWAYNVMQSYPNAEKNDFSSATATDRNSPMDSAYRNAVGKWADGTRNHNITILCSNMVPPPNTPTPQQTPTPKPTPSSTPKPTSTPTPPPPTPTTPPPPTKPDEDCSTTTTETVSAPPVVRTSAYAYITEVKRQVSSGEKDPIGKDNLHDQGPADPNAVTLTNFGKLYDDMTVNPSKYTAMTQDQVKALVDAAIASDKATGHNTLTLDDANKEGLSEGGVLNVSELTRSATITATSTQDREVLHPCAIKYTWNAARNDFDSKFVFGADTTKQTYPAVNVRKGDLNATPVQSGFWQILSVHCNPDQLAALKKVVTGETVEVTGDANIATVLYSKKYVNQPDFLDFGDMNNPNPAMAASGVLGFYDKECPFTCTTDPTGKGSAANGANTNILNKVPKGGSVSGKYGAVSGSVNSNLFTFFRDNSKHRITADVWYPKSSSTVDYKGEAPISTTITRWSQGTPSVTGDKGGKFTATTDTGKELFKGAGTSAPNQRNWDSKPFETSVSNLFAGLVRSVDVQASWASDKGRPQVLNFKWEYAPNVATIFKADNIGFDNNSKPIGETATVATPIQGKCYATFGSNSSFPTTNLFKANTGTGTVNSIDGSLVEGEALTNPTNLIINFVRSTTE